MKAHTSIAAPRSQALLFIGISAGVIALSSIGYASDHPLFERFLGPLAPPLACLAVAALGGVGLSVLAPRGFSIVAAGSRDALGRRSSLAVAFGLVAILVDVTVVFPADMNVRFPESLVFYPVVGFVVALIEPTFQAVLGFSGPYPAWTQVWVWVHVFLINLAQLIMFRRVEFVAMILFRLAYYGVWHIAWGHARLHLLF